MPRQLGLRRLVEDGDNGRFRTVLKHRRRYERLEFRQLGDGLRHQPKFADLLTGARQHLLVFEQALHRQPGLIIRIGFPVRGGAESRFGELTVERQTRPTMQTSR